MKRFSRFLCAALGLLTVLCGCASTSVKSEITQTDKMPKIDMTKWCYNSEDDVYYQVGIQYVSKPVDLKYETMGIFVPGKFFDAKGNGDGTYCVTINKENTVSGYNASNAPFVMPIETPGYASLPAPAEYKSSIKEYTDAGLIFVFSGARGREEGAPCGVTDFKAAIRYVRYNADILPGDTQKFFSFGMSGGGAQSAIIGATGDSAEYEPYLKEIGAVEGYSDAVYGSMAWCPITNLDVANEAYEWNMGMTRTNLDEAAQKLSDGLAVSFAEYINALGLKDEDGNVLKLEESAQGIYQAGSYYDYIKNLIEKSLNNFLSDNSFPLDTSKLTTHMPMLSTPNFGGRRPAMPEGGFEAIDNVRRKAVSGGVNYNGVFESAQSYIDALNANGKWIDYDSSSNTATITSISDFAKAVKVASKSVGAFDDLNATQGENTLFGYNDGKGAHFDSTMAELLKGSEYEQAFANDIAKTDSLGNSVQTRMNAYNPMYYLSAYYDGYKKSTVAKFWRIRSGIFQGDTAVCTEADLALALQNYGIENVDFATVWGLGHVEAERTGLAAQNFIEWVNECVKS